MDRSDRQTELQAENERLRKEIERLNKILYPPPPPPKVPKDSNRYMLLPRELRDHDASLWAQLQWALIPSAMDYVRKRHPNLRWHYVYGWDDIPEHGRYTTPREALGAKRSDRDVVLYKIDARTEALVAIQAERQRLRERESELHKSIPRMRSRSRARQLGERRVWAWRNHLLSEAHRRLDRPFQIACRPLVDYRAVERAATRIVDDALESERNVRLEDIPGYRPDGTWICEDCGYPYSDDEAREGGTVFSCCACNVANPVSHEVQAEMIERFRADGKNEIAEKLERSWAAAIEQAATGRYLVGGFTTGSWPPHGRVAASS